MARRPGEEQSVFKEVIDSIVPYRSVVEWAYHQPTPNHLLTEPYEAYFGFYNKKGDAKHAQTKGEPLMAFWVHGAPRVDGGRDGLDLAPSYVPEAEVINFGFPSEVADPTTSTGRVAFGRFATFSACEWRSSLGPTGEAGCRNS